ncbi:MAG TPA: SRPBCC domain-containing protein [Vicinamibacterales bacterium]|jgi:uncharacterized protein YndB with AHSA1/START domain
MTDAPTRSFTMSIDIDATPEEVWRALTDAGELVRWFPLQARVTPGEGGAMFWSWDDKWAWESTIEVWEPGKRLTLVENRPAFGVSGDPLPVASQQMAMEFTLETHKGGTRLRLVHSGFGHGAVWDDELDGVSGGWQSELRGLRLYVERHAGRDRHHTAINTSTTLAINEVWKRLLSPSAFIVADGTLAEGARCVIHAATGDRFEGTVAWQRPGRDVLMIVDALDSGIFRVSTWRAGGKTGAQVWITTYSDSLAARVREIGERVQPIVTRALA